MADDVPDLPLGAGGWRLPRLVVRAVDQVIKRLALLTDNPQQVVLSFGSHRVDACGADFNAHPASSSLCENAPRMHPKRPKDKTEKACFNVLDEAGLRADDNRNLEAAATALETEPVGPGSRAQ